MVNAAELRFIAGNQYVLSNVPITEITGNGEVIAPVAPEELCVPSFVKVPLARLLAEHSGEKIMLLDEEDLPMSAGVCRLEDGRCFLFGPVLYNSLSEEQRHALNRLLKKEETVRWIRKSTYIRLTTGIAAFIYDLERYLWYPEKKNRDMGEESDLLGRELVDYMITYEEPGNRGAYVNEQYILDILKSGNVSEMRRLMRTFRMEYAQVGENAAKKTDEYMAVATVAVAARGAIEAGVISSESFRLSDVYLRRLARCKTQQDILETRNQSVIDFTRLVQISNLKNEESFYIEDCKKDIASRIYQKISLDDIAEDLGMQKTYLARIFRASEGITVGKYIRREKMRIAKNMLIYSGYAVADIAAYLGFDSPSYFGKQFREETGMTPKKYRNRYHPAEF